MRTLLSWLIANLELASVIIFVPFIIMALKVHPEAALIKDTDNFMLMNVIAASLLIAVTAAPTSGVVGDLFALVLGAVGAVCVMGALSDSISDMGLIMFAVCSLAFGIVIAVYAVSNFYDVVSLRWLYANSDATKFEVSMAYGFSRFCNGTRLGAYIYAFIFGCL